MHGANSESVELGRRRAWSWRKRRVGKGGKDFGSRDLHVPAALRCPLRVLPCPWSPHSSCSLPWSAPGWLWELGLGFGSSRDIPAGASLLMSPSLSPSLRPCRHPGLSQTARLGVDPGNHPCSLSMAFGSGMGLAGPGAASHRKGDGSSSASPG